MNKTIEEKQKILLDMISDCVSNLLYYDRKECEELSIEDIKEVMTSEFADELAKKFRKELY